LNLSPVQLVGDSSTILELLLLLAVAFSLTVGRFE
jgi:hypothetical protein